MKAGANAQDQIIIARMAKEGSTAEEISEALGIEMSFIGSFMPKSNPVALKSEACEPAVAANPLKPKSKAK